jgi:asparagine N-glycosylation enzyme membrane subunit Stt3
MGAKITARLAGWALGALALTAGPWYLRNVLLFGHVIPKTVWTDQAVRTVENFFPFIRFPSRFFVAGLLFTLGLGWTILEGLTNHRDRHDRARLLLIYLLPFAAAWWWMASYDTRFLLTVLPLVAVMGAHVLIEGWDRLWGGRPLRPAVQIVLGVLLIGLALPSARTALIFKGDMLRHPLMSDATRHRIRLGPAYDVALYLNAIPAEGLILTDSQSLAPHVEPAQVVVGGLSSRDQLAHYRYLVLSNSNPLPDFVQPGDVSLLTEIGGFRVYRVDYQD